MKRPPRSSFVYFAHDEAFNLIKIGRTANVGARLAALDGIGKSSTKLRLIGAVYGSNLTEHNLHAYLRELRAERGKSREWYQYSGLLEQLLFQMSLPKSRIKGICEHGLHSCRDCRISRGIRPRNFEPAFAIKHARTNKSQRRKVS